MSSFFEYVKNPASLVGALGAKGYLNWFPDKLYLKIVYRARMGKKLNLKDPQTFSEKLQWLKLYDRKPVYTKMVDKIEDWKIIQLLKCHSTAWAVRRSRSIEMIINRGMMLQCLQPLMR